MTKRQVMKYLTDHYHGKKVNFGDHDFEFTKRGRVFHLVFLKIGQNAQLTVNSKTHFEVSVGKRDGIRFIKRQSTLYDFRKFFTKKNKIVFLLGKPFRMLQYLNESDIIDISDQTIVHDYRLFHSFKDFETL